jgi:hypothetical protein
MVPMGHMPSKGCLKDSFGILCWLSVHETPDEEVEEGTACLKEVDWQ